MENKIYKQNDFDNKVIKWTSIVINIIFILIGIAGLILSSLTIANLGSYNTKMYTEPLLTVGVILALYPMTRMLFKNLALHLKNEKIQRWSSNGYQVAKKTHLYASISAIISLIGHAVFWIYGISNGGYYKYKHGHWEPKEASFNFGTIMGLIALSLMVWLVISSLILKYNNQKNWIKNFRYLHITLALISALAIILHIATV